MTSNWKTSLVYVAAALALLTTAGSVWLLRWGQQNATPQSLEELVNDFTYLLIGVVMTLIGAFLSLRRGDNAVSWMMLGAGVSLSLVAFLEQYANLSYVVATGWPARMPALWLSQWVWMLPYVALILLLLCYPTGRLLSPRWRWVLGLSLLVYASLALWLGFSATLDVGDPALSQNNLPNPVGFLPAPGEVAFLTFTAAMLATVAAAVLGLAVRFRRARGIEREQMKWLLFAGALFIVAMLLDFIAVPYAGIITNLISLSIPAAIAVAILRYRLFDIDVIIRRTTSYALITGLLALVYFASIVVLQGVFGRLTNFDSTPAVVLSTLLIAALFLPVRRRVQDAIDRRFNRTRYDAEKTLQAFAATARDETDLDALLAELVRVIEATMQPEMVSVWLRPAEATEINDSARDLSAREREKAFIEQWIAKGPVVGGRTWKRDDLYDR